MPQQPTHAGEDWFRYALALEASQEGFWDWDLVAGRLWGSAKWQSMTGVTKPCSTLDTWLDRVHPQDKPRLEAELEVLRAGKAPNIANQHRVRGEDGAWRWVETHCVLSRDPAGRVIHVAGSLRDITSCRMADALTGLPNRSFFVDHVERRIERGFHHADWDFALLSVAVHHFDQFNETLGSAGGEQLLIATAERLEAILPDQAVAARLVGAEFMLFLDGIHAEEEAAQFAAQALAAFHEPFRWHGHSIVPLLAVGVAKAGMHHSHPEEIMADAESALLHARKKDPPGVVCYSRACASRLSTASTSPPNSSAPSVPASSSCSISPKSISAPTASSALKLSSAGVTPAVACFRLLNSFPSAEETGLIVPLGEWGLAEACRQLVAWHNTGSEQLQNARMSVNLSAKQLEQPNLVRQVCDVLAQTGLSPASLRLELTESSLISDAPAAQRIMCAIEQLGVGLHMDDFGTGYSSLDYLQRFPFDTLKIDRSFVRGIVHDRESHLIVDSILSLARSFGMDVVAEGIEDAEQLEELKTMGCPCGQGYYFARPMEPTAIDALVRTGAWKPQVPIAQA